MEHVQVNVNLDSVTELIQQMIDKALAVANDVPQLIKDQAALENEDVDGNQFPMKQPRPKNNPTNFPKIACVETGEMFDHARWTVERPDNTTAKVVYTPTDYFWHLIAKDPEKGGRKWLTPDKINATVEKEIQERMAKALEGE